MPLTAFQATLAKLLAANRSEDSHLAGGAALHFEPSSLRYSEDLDYFHDSEKRVASAFNSDLSLLEKNNYHCQIDIRQPGYIRCVVSKNKNSTKVEWAADSAWRFMPVQFNEDIGYILHPIDITINKLLALVGRNEIRDYLDVLYTHETILPLGAQCWAACGKDQGFTPLSLLELLKRRGKYQNQDVNRLNLTKSIDLKELKNTWLQAIDEAELFITTCDPEDIGCLYYSKTEDKFLQPSLPINRNHTQRHFGKIGGVLPLIKE